jgi:hypothetical protein
MTEAERLREQAARCLRLAKGSLASDVSQPMLKLAAEYLALAEQVEKAESSGQRQQHGNVLPLPQPEKGHQPALQQQQAQPNDDGDK